MWNATNATKKDIMRTNVPKLRQRIERRGRLKFEKWKRVSGLFREKVYFSNPSSFFDLESETKDPCMRFWVILSNLGQERIGVENEGRPVRVFVDTGANCNTISRKFYETLVS